MKTTLQVVDFIRVKVCPRVDTLGKLARWTGLEPATPGVTGRYSNQLSYHRATVSPRLPGREAVLRKARGGVKPTSTEIPGCHHGRLTRAVETLPQVGQRATVVNAPRAFHFNPPMSQIVL